MQSFKEINEQDYIKNSRTTINDSIKTVMSNNSGTAFPTTNLQVGMKCYRTDLGKTYTLTDVANNTWKEDNHATLADSANKLSGMPVTGSNDNQAITNKIPKIDYSGVMEVGKAIDFHSTNTQTTDYTTRITAEDNGTISVSGGINANLNGNASSASSVPWTGVTGKPSTFPPSEHNHDSAYPATNGSRATGTWDINITGKASTADNATKANTLTGFTRNDNHTWGSETGELVANFYLGDGAEIAFRKNNPSAGKTAMLIDGVIYQNEGLYKCIDENSINYYLNGAGIVSQQLGQDASYIKYANGLLVQKLLSSISRGENITGGCKVHLTLPVAFKDRFSYAAYTTVYKDTLNSGDGPFIVYFSPVSASKVDIIITNGQNSKDFYDIYVLCIGT